MQLYKKMLLKVLLYIFHSNDINIYKIQTKKKIQNILMNKWSVCGKVKTQGTMLANKWTCAYLIEYCGN